MTIRLKTDIRNLKKKDRPVLIASYYDFRQPCITTACELLHKIQQTYNKLKEKGFDESG